MSGVARVVLFGKVAVGREFKTCAVVVPRIERNVFLLLRDQGAEDAQANADAALAEFKQQHLLRYLKGSIYTF